MSHCHTSRCRITALRAGVRRVHVVDGRDENAVLLAATTDSDLGTTLLSTATG
jgi:acetylglutamate kinase